MNSQNSLIQRYDKQLAALIEGKNWKQALSWCEKRLKKGGSAEDILVQKAIILLEHSEPTRKQQGQREIAEILERHPPISELKALECLNTAFQEEKILDPRIQTIWERAVTVRPDDEEIYLKWFQTKFRERKWTAAQKAASLYMKNFPEKREPFFWNILTYELGAIDATIPDKDRAILRPLAYRFLSRAIEKTESGNQGKTSEGRRSIQTLEELLLLLRIYRLEKKFKEAIAILNSTKTGIYSHVGNFSWELVRHKIEMYEICDRWTELWQFCQELLEDALPINAADLTRTPNHMFHSFGDDWKVWVGLLTAAIKIGTHEVNTRTEHMMGSFIRPKTLSRNARLALVKFYADKVPIADGSSEYESVQENLFSACSAYFSDYSMKTTCFHDLRPYVSFLSRSRQEKFLIFIADVCRSNRPKSEDPDSRVISWITTETNALKFDYCLLISRVDIDCRHDVLNAFVCICLRLFKISLPLGSTFPASERHPGDDAAILAVMGLIHIEHLTSSSTVPIFRAIVILEALVAQSRCNYDALLILVRLYTIAGMGSLAMHYYAQLSIKNVQNATISWILLTRISTIHPLNPYPVGNEPPFDLLEHLTKILDWSINTELSYTSSIDSMLNFGQYNSVLETLTNPKHGWSNFPVHMVVAELQRAERFSPTPNPKNFGLSNVKMPALTADSRDLQSFPDCEALGQPPFIEYLRNGRPPNDYWLATQLKQSQLWGFLQKFHHDLAHGEADRVIRESKESDEDALTLTEGAAAQTTHYLEVLCILALSINQPPGTAQRVWDTFSDMMAKLDGWYCDALWDQENLFKRMDKTYGEVFQPHWYYYHMAFITLDICRFTLATIDFLDSQKHFVDAVGANVWTKTAAQLAKSARNLCTACRQTAAEQRKLLQRPDATRKLSEVILGQPADMEDPIGLELQQMFDESWLDEVVEKTRTSWVEALGGIGDIKVF